MHRLSPAKMTPSSHRPTRACPMDLIKSFCCARCVSKTKRRRLALLIHFSWRGVAQHENTTDYDFPFNIFALDNYDYTCGEWERACNFVLRACVWNLNIWMWIRPNAGHYSRPKNNTPHAWFIGARDATQHTDHRGERREKEKSPAWSAACTLEESGNVNKTTPITARALRFYHAAFAPFSWRDSGKWTVWNS